MQRFTTYRGWDTLSLENRWLTVHIVPKLGGRIMQLSLGEDELLFVNRSLEGEADEGLSGKGIWKNFGGEKVWPAPQGWSSEGQWPGPPDPVLDGGEYRCEVKEKGQNEIVSLTSPKDNYTGLQINREISLKDDSSCVHVKVTFSNIKGSPVRWSVWSVCQVALPEESIGGKYKIVTPVSCKSKFNGGYKVLHGLANNPQFTSDKYGNMIVDYQYLVGKVGIDSSEGWVAFVDIQTGKVLVMSFDAEQKDEHPDDASIQIWTQGSGETYARGRVNRYPSDRQLNPPYMEMEILSPLKLIAPAQEYSFSYRMSACTIKRGESIMCANEFGVISKPLTIEQDETDYHISGQYGLFSQGVLKLKLTKRDEKNIMEEYNLYESTVNPLEGIGVESNLATGEPLIGRDSLLSLELYDLNNHFVGEIDKLKIEK